MARTIAVCNQKGGVGKSTTAVNVGAYLAASGRKTLLVDLDPQGNLTTSCGVNRSILISTIYESFVNGVEIEKAIVKTQVELLELLPSNQQLVELDSKLSGSDGPEQVLRRLIEPVRERYEVVLFDCPPSLGLLTMNALAAADFALVPAQCEYLSLEGLTALTKAIEVVRNSLNPDLTIAGIVLTMADFRVKLTKEVAEEVKQFFKGLVFDTWIPRNVRLAESPSFGQPICLYDAGSAGAQAYKLLTEELAFRIGLGQRAERATANDPSTRLALKQSE